MDVPENAPQRKTKPVRAGGVPAAAVATLVLAFAVQTVRARVVRRLERHQHAKAAQIRLFVLLPPKELILVSLLGKQRCMHQAP